MSNKWRARVTKWRREMRWDRERARQQMKRDTRARHDAIAYTHDLARRRPDVPERSKAQMRAELERLGVSADKPVVGGKPREKPVWSEWKTVTREDGTTYQERECHCWVDDLYQADGTPW